MATETNQTGTNGNGDSPHEHLDTKATSSSVDPVISLTFDRAINYAFQQNAIPVVKELRIRNDNKPRKNLTIRVTTEPVFAFPVELRLQSMEAEGEFFVAPLDLKLSPEFLAGLNEKLTGLLKVEVVENNGNGETTVFKSVNESVTLLAHNEWCGLVSLPEILAAFVLPNDPAVMTILSRASEILKTHTGRSALNGYQDKSRKVACEQVAAIYKAIINGSLATSAAIAQTCLGVLWNKGEPSADILIKVRVWGETLHKQMVACAGDNPAFLEHLRKLLANLFLEGPSVYASGTDIGNRMFSYRDTFTKLNEVFDRFAKEVRLQCDTFETATDYLATVVLLTERLPAAWSKLRLWCAWQKVRQEGLHLHLEPIIRQLESPNGDTLDLRKLFERSFRRALLFAIFELEPILRDFFGHEHDDRIKHFCNIDEKLGDERVQVSGL